MSTDEYVPSDARMREQYIWAHAREAEGVAEQSYGIQVCSEVWDAWLAAHDARVRRDAAREALDGLARWHQETADLFDEHSEFPGNRAHHDESLNRRAETLAYRDTHYPEEPARRDEEKR